MSKFEVKVSKINKVEDHPNADRLAVVTIGGYRCIANKNHDGTWRYQTGDLVVYVPEQAVIPEMVLKTIGFWDDSKGKGMLGGSKGDRVRAIKLRDIVSQGILIPLDKIPAGNLIEGTDVADLLGIVKYEPEIPASMSGDVWNASGMTIKYDIESIQKHPGVFLDRELVVVTEKLHGTWSLFGIHVDENGSKTRIVSSKGLSARGLAFKFTEENVAKNLYLQVLERTRNTDGETLLDLVEKIMLPVFPGQSVYVLGETFGRGVQDLAYGEQVPTLRVFDIYVGSPGAGHYLNTDNMAYYAHRLEVESVPRLYTGEFNMDKMTELRDGIDFSGSNIREGIVIRPLIERIDPNLGRVQVKYVSPDYLLRKGGTEFN